MNDEPDLELEAASASFDDAATPDERALVEASPARRADVERFAVLRDALRDVTPPAGARESAIAAAMAAFDEAPAPSTVPSVVRLADRRRWRPALAVGAAAAIVLAFVGAVLVIGGGTDDDEAADVAVEESTARMESAPAFPAATTAAPLSVSEPDDEAGDAAGAEPEDATELDEPVATEAPAEIEFPAETEAADTLPAPAPLDTAPAATVPAATEAADAEPPDTTSAQTTAAGLPRIVGREALLAFAAARQVDEVPASTPMAESAPCLLDDDLFVGLAIYRDTPVVIVVRESGEVRALEPDECRLVANAYP